MSVITVVHALFPNTAARSARRRPAADRRLSQLIAVAFALVPLAMMGQVFAQAV